MTRHDNLAEVLADAPRALAIPGGGMATVRGGALEVADAEGRLLLRVVDGAVELSVATGDLVLAAPNGRVVVRGSAIALETDGELTQRAERVSIEAESTHTAVRGEATLIARRVVTAAAAIAQTTARYELEATRLVERTREVFRDTEELLQTRAGRMRTVVTDVFALFSRRTALKSTDDTAIDGSKILLG